MLLTPDQMQPSDLIAFRCLTIGSEALEEKESQPALNVCRALGKALAE